MDVKYDGVPRIMQFGRRFGIKDCQLLGTCSTLCAPARARGVSSFISLEIV